MLLLVDLFLVHPAAHEVSIRNALWSTVGFIAISVAFGIGLQHVVDIGVGVSCSSSLVS